MIAIAMYILLGVFATLLLTLFVMPLIWRRAVRLTEKRIMAEIPLSYSELKAEKDMQRAEQAIDLRRLEITAEARLEDVANKTMKIEQLNRQLQRRDELIEQKDAVLSERDAQISALQQDVLAEKQVTGQTEEQLGQTRDKLNEARATFESLKGDIEHLEHDKEELETVLNERKIELVANLARIENNKEEISELTAQLSAETTKRTEVESLLAQRTSEWERAKERLERSDDKISQLQSQIADKDTEIDTVKRHLERALAQKPSDDNDSAQKLAEAETRRLEAEAKIASLTLQLDSQPPHIDPVTSSPMASGPMATSSALIDETATTADGNGIGEGGDDQNEKIAQIMQEKEKLQKQLDASSKEKDELLDKLKIIEKQIERTEQQREASLSQNELILRNEIKDIAARITEFAAKTEGDASPIHDILARPDQPVDISGQNGAPEPGQTLPLDDAPDGPPQEISSDASSENTDNADKPDPWNQVFSLADRIRKMGSVKDEHNAPH